MSTPFLPLSFAFSFTFSLLIDVDHHIHSHLVPPVDNTVHLFHCGALLSTKYGVQLGKPSPKLCRGPVFERPFQQQLLSSTWPPSPIISCQFIFLKGCYCIRNDRYILPA